MWLYPKAQTLAANIFYSKNNGRLSHSHILNPRELTLCPKEIQKRIDVGWTIRRYLNLRLENRVGWMEKGQHRGGKRKLGKILSSYYAQDTIPGPFICVLPHLVLKTVPRVGYFISLHRS